MRRRGPILALAAVLLALPSPAGAAEQRSKCQKLDATNDLAPATRVKLVRRENDAGGNDLVGCVLPEGDVNVVASSSKQPGVETRYRVLQVAGHHVLVRGTLINQYGRGVSTYVFDLKRGKSYNIAEVCFDDQGGACKPQRRSVRALINAQGQAAAIVHTEGSTKRQVVGFKSTGTPKVLDTGTAAEIPASSLSLEGHVVRWTHSGAPRSASLARSECQKLKATNDLAPAKRVKLVRRQNADGGNDLVGCVLPDGEVTVVASSAKQTAVERRYRILQVVGHEVLVRGTVINQYGRGVTTYVYDIKVAGSYNIAETCFDDQGGACKPQRRSVRAFVNAQGQAAAIVHTEGSTKRRVVGYKSNGTPTVLDTGTAAEIPASSLSLEGHVVRWRHSGALRSATLSG